MNLYNLVFNQNIQNMAKRIEAYKWQRMSDDEVIEYWESHGYAETFEREHNTSGFGFSSFEALNNYSNCKEQMFDRGLL